MKNLLEIRNLKVNYGAIEALKGVTLEVKESEIVTLIGSNGAGKSTLLKSISGLQKVNEGEILFEGNSLINKKPREIVVMGITQVPEGRHIFPGMSVYENLLMGGYTRKDQKKLGNDLTEVYKQFPILKERKDQDASTLSGGEQQMLAIGRALMAKPKLLLLDEPSMGLSPILVKEIFEIIKSIQQNGTTILLNEQNAKMALKIADRGYVMENGKIVLSGTGESLAASKEVQKAYLGG